MDRIWGVINAGFLPYSVCLPLGGTPGLANLLTKYSLLRDPAWAYSTGKVIVSYRGSQLFLASPWSSGMIWDNSLPWHLSLVLPVLSPARAAPVPRKSLHPHGFPVVF